MKSCNPRTVLIITAMQAKHPIHSPFQAKRCNIIIVGFLKCNSIITYFVIIMKKASKASQIFQEIFDSMVTDSY